MSLTPEMIVAAILSIFPHMNGRNRECIERNQPRIIQQLHDVSLPSFPGAPVPPVELTASVAFLETHLGCDANEGGNWGAPISATRRHTAGTHMHAVRVLANGYLRCGTWEGAVLRFRTGLCNPARQSNNPALQVQGTNYLRTVNNIMHRISTVRASISIQNSLAARNQHR
jgi:hypothetical protein